MVSLSYLKRLSDIQLYGFPENIKEIYAPSGIGTLIDVFNEARSLSTREHPVVVSVYDQDIIVDPDSDPELLLRDLHRFQSYDGMIIGPRSITKLTLRQRFHDWKVRRAHYRLHRLRANAEASETRVNRRIGNPIVRR